VSGPDAMVVGVCKAGLLDGAAVADDAGLVFVGGVVEEFG